MSNKKLFIFLLAFFIGLIAFALIKQVKICSDQLISNQNEISQTIKNKDVNIWDSNSPNTTPIKDEPSTRKTNCINSNKYLFHIVENPSRKQVTEQLMPNDLDIIVGNEVIAKIEMPNAEAKNFKLNSVKKNKTGFKMRVEWGGSLYHYEIQFDFVCKGNNFYLSKVKNENFFTTNSENGNFLDKKVVKETKIEPNLLIKKFVMTDYLE